MLISKLLLTKASRVAMAGADRLSSRPGSPSEGYESQKAGGGGSRWWGNSYPPLRYFLKSGTVQFCRSQLPLAQERQVAATQASASLMERPAQWLRPPATATHHSGEGREWRWRMEATKWTLATATCYSLPASPCLPGLHCQ